LPSRVTNGNLAAQSQKDRAMTKEAEKYHSMHRFGDEVAMHFTGTPTMYLSKEHAFALAKDLTDYANNINNCSYTVSLIGTTTYRVES
jgi:hypothetical protein